jgi:hypothetical protein
VTSPMHIVVEVIGKATITTNKAQHALDFLMEYPNDRARVSVEGNSESILVLAGIADIQRRNAAPISVGHDEASVAHLPYAERHGGTYRNRPWPPTRPLR